MFVIPIDDLNDPRIADFRNVPDPELLRQRGVFIAEGRLVVRALLTASRYRPRALLVTETALRSVQDLFDGGQDDEEEVPLFLATPACMHEIIGFNVHRGCLALGERPAELSMADVLPAGSNPRLVVALEGLGNADNIGGVFRNAAAFGADAILLSPGCCDPLYRKAIRVSMGASLSMPFAPVADWPDGVAALRERGFSIVALTPDLDATDLREFASAARCPRRVALLLGTEGDGLSPDAKALADARVRIAMQPGVDSLNVATAVGIALHHFQDC